MTKENKLFYSIGYRDAIASVLAEHKDKMKLPDDGKTPIKGIDYDQKRRLDWYFISLCIGLGFMVSIILVTASVVKTLI